MDTDTPHRSATSATSEHSLLENLIQTKPRRSLVWRSGNAKLKKNTIHLSIPAGHTCKPWATECLAFADKDTGKITDGPEQKFRCYAASMEAIYKTHRNSLWNNYEILNEHIHEPVKLYKLLLHSVLPIITQYVVDHEQWPKIRLFGTSGDFWHKNMYLACLALASALRPIRVYWYTKAIPFIIKYESIAPDNLEQNASVGGRYDHLITLFDLKYAKVVYSFEEAKELGLPIDQRDELASEPGGPFAIPLHGVQPKGSAASKAIQEFKKKGFHGYSKK